MTVLRIFLADTLRGILDCAAWLLDAGAAVLMAAVVWAANALPGGDEDEQWPE